MVFTAWQPHVPGLFAPSRHMAPTYWSICPIQTCGSNLLQKVRETEGAGGMPGEHEWEEPGEPEDL